MNITTSIARRKPFEDADSDQGAIRLARPSYLPDGPGSGCNCDGNTSTVHAPLLDIADIGYKWVTNYNFVIGVR